MAASAPCVSTFMPLKPSTPSRVNDDDAPGVVEATWSRYCPGEVWTAVARTPLPAALMPATTSLREPLPTEIWVAVPSAAVRVTGPLATTAPVEPTDSAETRAWAAARAVTSKVREPLVVPVAVAVTDDEVEVTVVPTHAEVFARLPARPPTVASAAVELAVGCRRRVCCVDCWFLSRVCWFGLERRRGS